MPIIAAEGMTFYAYHGFYEEEQAIGNWYEVDAYLEADIANAERDDDLNGTVNYGSVFLLTRLEMSKPAHLMESLAQRLLLAYAETFTGLKSARVRISKLHPPLEEKIAKAYIEMTHDGRTTIGLTGIELYAYHGYYDEEQIIGNHYWTDIAVSLSNVKAAVKDDDFGKTVSYESLFWIVRHEMQIKTKLLEAIGARILNSIKEQFSDLNAIHLRIAKQKPPVESHALKRSFIEWNENYEKLCPRCKGKLNCYNSTSCWCNSLPPLFPATRDFLKQRYKTDCLCAECLAFFVGKSGEF